MNADGTDIRRLTSGTTPLGYAQPAWSPDGSTIAFVVLREPPGSLPAIYSMNVDGTGMRKLTSCVSGGCAESQPSWSPGGRRIAFVRDQDIYVMGPTGANITALVRCSSIPSCASLGTPVWSPDGTQLLYSLERSDSRRSLYVMDLQSSEADRLLPGKADDCCASWQPIPREAQQPTQPTVSNGEIWFQRAGGEGGTWIEAVEPDGTNRRILFSDTYAGGNEDVGAVYDWTKDGSKVVFLDSSGHLLGDVPTGSSWELYTMNPDGTGKRQVTDDGGFDGPPSWSPDGTRIVYASDRADPQRPACEMDHSCNVDIFVISADGSDQVQLTSDPGYDWQPDWSPDGMHIAFAKGGNLFGGDLYVMNTDGTVLTKLTNGADSQPMWSPDGATIAFIRHKEQSFDLYVMDADGGNQRLLASGLPATHAVEPDLFRDFSWAPDGTMIAFVSGGEAGTMLSVVDVISGETTKLVEDPTGIAQPGWRPVPA
jgi:Tol biopolymer transport system component